MDEQYCYKWITDNVKTGYYFFVAIEKEVFGFNGEMTGVWAIRCPGKNNGWEVKLFNYPTSSTWNLNKIKTIKAPRDPVPASVIQCLIKKIFS